MSERFQNRSDAGRQLAQQLINYAQQARTIVLGLPRGGVPVAAEIAKALQLPLDICLVHKLGVPRESEVAMGAIDLQGRCYVNERLVRSLGISADTIERIAQAELQELQRRERVYRGDRPPLMLHEQIVIVVDDGLATGATAIAAINSIDRQQPARIIVAIPVASRQAIAELRQRVNAIVCLKIPESFYAIGSWYEDFSQTTDAEVFNALAV